MYMYMYFTIRDLVPTFISQNWMLRILFYNIHVHIAIELEYITLDTYFLKAGLTTCTCTLYIMIKV